MGDANAGYIFLFNFDAVKMLELFVYVFFFFSLKAVG